MKLAQPQTLPKKIGRSPKSKRAKRKGVGGKEFLPFCSLCAVGAVGAETLGGIYSKSASEFSLKKVRISFRIRSQIVCSTFVASPLRGSASPPEAGKADFERICHAPRGSKNNSRSRKIRFAQVYLRFRESETANLFSRPMGELQSDNYSAQRNCPKAILLKK